VADCGQYYKVHPWWGTTRPKERNREFSSNDNVVDIPAIKAMIAESDREFEAMEMPGGEFANF
jgi:hypothetical protein